MSQKLEISDNLGLPTSALSSTQAILAIKGAGKTYAAMKMMEEAVKSGFQCIAIDPTGVWFGLSADGTGKGLPVLVMGGEHGNVPLESTSGEVVAEFIVDSGRSVVLDLSLMRKAEMHRFMAAFLDKLYHYKATHRENIHVFFDEADTAAPQSPGPEQAKVLGAAEDVVRRGRSRGLGMTLISQRPAVINKNLLEMCETLYVMRVIGSNDQDAIRKRVKVDADDATVDKMMSSLASLENGEAWVWSPAALNIFKRIRFAPKTTFDSGRSPKPGERMIQPRARAEIDLNDLTARIKATVDKAKENDPKHLRSQLQRLQLELTKLQQAKPTVTERIVEKAAVTPGQIKSVEKVAATLEREGNRRIKMAGELMEHAKELSASGQRLAEEAKAFAAALVQATAGPMPQRAPMPSRPAIHNQAPPRRIPAPIYTRGTSINGEADDLTLNKIQKRILNALAWYESLGNMEPTAIQVGAVALVDPTGGYFSNSVGPLSTAGLIERGSGTLRLTDAGRAQTHPVENVGTLSEYHDVLRGRVRKMRSASNKTIQMLDAIISASGRSITTAQIGEAVGVDHTGGYFSNSIGPLGTVGLIERKSGTVAPTEVLFPPGLI